MKTAVVLELVSGAMVVMCMVYTLVQNTPAAPLVLQSYELYQKKFKLATTTVIRKTTITTITTTTTTTTKIMLRTIVSWAIVVMCMVYTLVQNTPAAPLVLQSYGVIQICF